MIPLYVLFGISSESEAYGFLPEDLQLYFQTQSYTRNRMIVAKATEHYDRDYKSMVKVLRNLIGIPSSTIKYSNASVHDLQAFGLIWKHMNDEFRSKYSKVNLPKLFKAVSIEGRQNRAWNKAVDFVVNKNINAPLDNNLRFNALDDMYEHLSTIIKQSKKINKPKDNLCKLF